MVGIRDQKAVGEAQDRCVGNPKRTGDKE